VAGNGLTPLPGGFGVPQGGGPSHLAMLGTRLHVVCVKSISWRSKRTHDTVDHLDVPVFADGAANGSNQPWRTRCGRNALSSDPS
jgi:hypothetical protein